MKTNVFLLCVALALSLAFAIQPGRAFAEERDVGDMAHRERIFIGGFMGLQVGTFTAVSVNLHAGYRITNRLSAGLGGHYQYTNDKWFGESYRSHVYGANAFARFRVYSHFFLHTEYERLRLDSRAPMLPDDFDPDDRERITEQNYLLGVGYGLPVSDRVRVNLLLLYNFNQDSHAHFDNPFFRVGVDVYL